MINTLDVMLWGHKVGTLVQTTAGYKKGIVFFFDPEFVRIGLDIAPLRASVHSVAAIKGLPIYGESEKFFGGLPSFIADSLPDQWGNMVFAEWLKSRKISMRQVSALDRLAYIGRRGMGALEFVPASTPDMEQPLRVQVEDLYRLSQRALSEAKAIHGAIPHDFAIESLFRVGTSAGGRRPKAVVNVNFDTEEFYSGQVDTPLPGFRPMIIKFDEHGTMPTTRIEYSYYLMARESGLRMMESSLYEGENSTHFLTERFDRTTEGKLHIQTLAALNPQSQSYESLFGAARRIGVSQEDMKQIFMAMVMNIACANVDDHNKNFSFIMKSDGNWSFAPVYDFTFSCDLSAPGYVNRHSMSVNGKVENVGCADVIAVAENYDIRDAVGLIDKVVDVVSRYPSFAARAGVSNDWIHKISEEINYRVSLLK